MRLRNDGQFNFQQRNLRDIFLINEIKHFEVEFKTGAIPNGFIYKT